MNQAHGRELALQRLLGKRYTKVEPRRAPGQELAGVPLGWLRTAIEVQSREALQLSLDRGVPIPNEGRHEL